MALNAHMPQEVADIILQHHGDTPVMFFYHKALQMSDGTAVDMSEFRYAGPRPNTREAAIVMLADTIEAAAVRSLPDPTPQAIETNIEKLVRGKLEDGQLSDSPITLRDIDDICNAFSGVLRGVYHERIEYPEVRHHVPVQSVSRQDEPEKQNAAESGLKEPAREKAPVQTEEAGGDHSETHAQSAAGQAAETNEMKENQE